MRTIATLALVAILAGCATGRPIDKHLSQKSVHIETPAGYKRNPELFDYAAKALAGKGYDAVNNEEAPYRLRQTLDWGTFRIALSVRLIGPEGKLVYTGECTSPGGGGFVDSYLIERCYTSALERLE